MGQLCCPVHISTSSKPRTGQPLDRNQIMAEIGIMWGAGFEVRPAQGDQHSVTRTLPQQLPCLCSLLLPVAQVE